MTILSPTGLESTPMGVGGWNAINTANAERLNTQLGRVWPMIDGETPADGQVAVYDAASGTWMPSDDVGGGLASELLPTHTMNGLEFCAFMLLLSGDGTTLQHAFSTQIRASALSEYVGTTIYAPVSAYTNTALNTFVGSGGACVDDSGDIILDSGELSTVSGKLIGAPSLQFCNDFSVTYATPYHANTTIDGVLRRRLQFKVYSTAGRIDLRTFNGMMMIGFTGYLPKHPLC